MEKVEGYEQQSFPPSNKTINNLNKSSRDIEFLIDIGDGFMHPHNADCYVEYEVVSSDPNHPYEHQSNIKLIDNFFPFLFSEIEIKKHGQVIERIENPGITATSLISCMTSTSDAVELQKSGFTTKENLGNGRGEILYPLKLLSGFCRDYKDVLWKGGLSISFKRESNEDALFRWQSTGETGIVVAVPPEGKFLIKNMEIRMPIVEYESNFADLLRAKMLDEQKLPIAFRSAQCIEKTGFHGTTLEFDLTTQFISLQFDMPDFVIVLFQTNRNNNQKRDSSVFDHCNVKNVSFRNGRNEIFPKEAWNLDIDNKKFLKMYDAYTALKRVICQNTEVLYSPSEFLINRPMYVLNTSKRKGVVVNNKTSIKLIIDFQRAIPDGTTCYAILLGQKHLAYDIMNGKIIEEF